MKKKMSVTAAIKKATAEIIDQGHGNYTYLDDKGNSWVGHFPAGYYQTVSIRNERAKRAIINIFGDGWDIDPTLYDALCQPGSLRDVVKDAVAGIQKRFVRLFDDSGVAIVRLNDSDDDWGGYYLHSFYDIFGKYNGCDEWWNDSEIEAAFDYIWRTGDASTLDDVRAILRKGAKK